MKCGDFVHTILQIRGYVNIRENPSKMSKIAFQQLYNALIHAANAKS